MWVIVGLASLLVLVVAIFAIDSAAHDGLKYGDLLQQILQFGLQYRAEWKLA